MADDVDAGAHVGGDVTLCPTCNQVWIAAEEDSASSPHTAPSKRKDTSVASSKSPATKKLRSSGSVGHTRVWDSRPDYPVWVHAYDGNGGRGWIPGIVDHVNDQGDRYFITVHVRDGDNGWVVPRTIKATNADPIPSSVPNDDNYKLADYIRGRNEKLGGASVEEIKRWKCMQYHANASVSGECLTDLGPVSKGLLDPDPESTTSLGNLVQAMMTNARVKEVVKVATGDDMCSVEYALAYFVGQFCGIELSDAGTEKVDPKRLLDQIVYRDVVDCPISQVFLHSAMIARTKKTTEFHPANSLYDSRARAILSEEKKLEERMKKLNTALAALHASQTDRPPLTGPAYVLLSHGINMMIDMRGTSDPLLKKLAREGICRPPQVLRYWIQKIAEAIKPLETRSTVGSGQSHVIAWTADNADYHLFHRCVSVVPVGNILLGLEAKADTAHFNQNYMRGLGRIENVVAEDIEASSEDDRIAQNAIDSQNVLAILTAFADYGQPYLNPGNGPNIHVVNLRDQVSVGSEVAFTYRSKEWKGTVASISRTHADISFVDGNRQTTKRVPVENITSTNSSIRSASASASSQGPEVDPLQQRGTGESDRVAGSKAECDASYGGERYNFEPTTTAVASVLTGLSSKNNETARERNRRDQVSVRVG